MVNTEAFIRRLEKILQFYGLTATAFAEQIGVQPSSISHLLSGRNKPSLEFVLKVVKRFPEVNLYWLLNGKGSFPAPTRESRKEEEAVEPAAPAPTPGIKKIIIFYEDGSFETYSENLSPQGYQGNSR